MALLQYLFAVSNECEACTLIYCCRGCLCTGCRAMSTQAIRLSYFHTSRLFSIGEKKRTRVPSVYKLAGASLARVLHSHICLLLHSHAQYSVTHNVLLQAQLCLQASVHCLAHLPQQLTMCATPSLTRSQPVSLCNHVRLLPGHSTC